MKNYLNAIFICFIISLLFHCTTGTITVKDEKPENKEKVKTEKKEEKLRPLRMSEEALLGKAISAKIMTAYGLVRDKKISSYINGIGQTLAMASERPDTYSGYLFAVLDTEKPAAYAAPDGLIFVSKGLVKNCRNEDELAYLLAKEISHIVNNDPINNLDKQVIHDMNKSFQAKKNNLPDREALAKAFALAVDAVMKNLETGYSQDINTKAFKAAVNILAKTGYSVYAVNSILSQISSDSLYAKMNFDIEKVKKEINNYITNLEADKTNSNMFKKANANRLKRFQSIADAL